nr:hypothetical protein CFP56_12504 [Quercus suber]
MGSSLSSSLSDSTVSDPQLALSSDSQVKRPVSWPCCHGSGNGGVLDIIHIGLAAAAMEWECGLFDAEI